MISARAANSFAHCRVRVILKWHFAGAGALILFTRFRNAINSPALMISSRARISNLKGLDVINGQRDDRETGGSGRRKP